jgi:phosphoribosylanthranilate isomerase
MKLVHVTITGIDDEVPLQWVEDFSVQYRDKIEFGVLFSRKRKGSPRYPSPNWLCEFLERFADSDAPGMFSAHMCGEMSDKMTATWVNPFSARDAFGTPAFDVVFDRVQLNGFSDGSQDTSQINTIASIFKNTGIILPIPSEKTLERCRTNFLENVYFMHDRSRGRGIKQDTWPEAGLPGFVGYAGGIDHTNIKSVAGTLSARPEDRDYWLDLETGVRTDDRFDRKKAEKIMRNAEEYLE